MTYISGGDTVVLYAFENPTKWNGTAQNHTASDETYMPFGHGVEVTLTRNNNSERIFGIGQRNASSAVNKNYDGTFNVTGTLANAYWLLGVLGTNTNGGTTGAYTHTYTEANTLPSFTINASMELGTTDHSASIVGCKIDNCSISAAVNEAVKFTLEGAYRYETLGSTKLADNLDIEPIFTFAHGSIEMPDGTSIGAVQNFELNITNSNELLSEVGSRFKRAIISKNREYNFTMNVAFNSVSTLMTYFMNGTSSATNPTTGSGTEVATLELTFTNDDGDILDINLTGVHLNEDSINFNVNEVIKENVTGFARACTNIIYTNDVQTAPAEADN